VLARPDRAATIIGREARAVLRAYSTSFFMVTRFLPPRKRERVEAIYAAVRYPDEIVDTFPLTSHEKHARLTFWAGEYRRALAACSVQGAVAAGVPCFLAQFGAVVRECAIPPVHYDAFLDAMRQDAGPRTYATVDELIDSYVYGSAVVVGYFLTHVYGATHPREFDRALRSARDLAIALQLTNFLRDVREDQRRGRIYMPQDLLHAEGIGQLDLRDLSQHGPLARVRRHLAATAETLYGRAAADLGAFAPDSRSAIKACIDVYRLLNHRIARSHDALEHRARVPFADKYRVLPASKYWRLPLAYLAH
jgi:phytoene synthase